MTVFQIQSNGGLQDSKAFILNFAEIKIKIVSSGGETLFGFEGRHPGLFSTSSYVNVKMACNKSRYQAFEEFVALTIVFFVSES